MGLYLDGSEKLKIILNGVVYKVNIYSSGTIVKGIRLLSSDNYILQDSNGVYLTVSDTNYLFNTKDNNI